MGYSPRFKMPDETLGERWHKEAENENPVVAFLAFSSCMVVICLIVVMVGGTQNQAMGYFEKEEIREIPRDIPHVQQEPEKETESNQIQEPPVEETIDDQVMEQEPVFEEVVYSEEPAFCYDQPVDVGYSDWMVAGGDTSLRMAGSQYSADGTRYTWYSENVLPGGGLNIPGRHVGDGGYIMDGDGNICVASSDHEIGTVLETPYGTAVVYDTGCANGTVDIYTSW